ncbi:phosphonopyruvate decarboxylase [Desulfuromusa kysingii]|uniref:Phosphonopyruvate decarboxylase n=1 Tax=Desulfuromusa kysingii TaxID=37625 RepID=A0A1H4CXC4_9BACT|nr:phosphonopyruvate decarboxylase [Desulfuromusa kysingii]SEA64990.1 phosphonopyruvate decarboxylase [Desulfuromusa kysingii]
MKISAADLGNELKSLGFEFYCGVPCSFLNNLINYAINECDYVMSNNEGDAVAICAGAYLAGKKSVVLMQNSGLTNATSPLTSLNYSFKLPVLGFVSLRGEPRLNDEPQHELMGTITEKMLELMQVKWEYLSNDIAEVKCQIARANESIENKESFFFIVKKGVLGAVELKPQQLNKNTNKFLKVKSEDDELAMRLNVIETITATKADDTVILATTGKTGRELYEVEDSQNNLYMVGSMGSISSIGLGIALNSNMKTIAVDGDGALLMRMGNLATNAYYSPANLLHVLIDNNMHDSTGGQFTVSSNVDFVQIAASTGYENSIYVHSLDELKKTIIGWYRNPVLTFIYIKVRNGTKENLGRPKIKPYEVKERLMEFIRER